MTAPFSTPPPNRTVFLRPERSPIFSLSYTQARAALSEADASDERRYRRDLKAAEQLRQHAAKLNNIGVNSGSDLLLQKTKQLKQRAEKLEDAAKPAHLERSAGTIKLANRGTHAKVLIALDDAAVATPDGRLLFKTGKQFICKGDRIVLLGPNGAGKTRLVAMLRQAIESPEATQAGIKVTQSLALGYCEQNLADLCRCRHADAHDRQPFRGRRSACARIARRRRPVGCDAKPSDRPAFRRTEGASRHASAAACPAKLLSAR
jgi:ATPase subunit of ABC transporter with duplicated ATPase domains